MALLPEYDETCVNFAEINLSFLSNSENIECNTNFNQNHHSRNNKNIRLSKLFTLYFFQRLKHFHML